MRNLSDPTIPRFPQSAICNWIPKVTIRILNIPAVGGFEYFSQLMELSVETLGLWRVRTHLVEVSPRSRPLKVGAFGLGSYDFLSFLVWHDVNLYTLYQIPWWPRSALFQPPLLQWIRTSPKLWVKSNHATLKLFLSSVVVRVTQQLVNSADDAASPQA